MKPFFINGKSISLYTKRISLRILYFVLVALTISIGSISAVALIPNTNNGKAIIVIIDRISLEELYKSNTPNIDRLLNQGALGLMTTNTAGGRSQRDAYITMGAGTKAVGSERSRLGLSAAEKYQDSVAKELFRQNTGIEADENMVLNLGIAQCIRNNEKKPYNAKIGALGAALKNGGIKTAVFGNCDTPMEYKRYITTMFMDSDGVIPLGFVDNRYLKYNSQRPFGLQTDYDLLLKDIDSLWNDADVIAVQLGDTSRAEDFRYEATDELNALYKQQAIENSDVFIGHLMERIDLNRDLFVILTPLGPSEALAENNRLTPFIIAGPGYAKGLATSSSTRIPGVITNLDFAITVISFFGLNPVSGQSGSIVRSIESNKGMLYLVDYNIRLMEIYNHRYLLLRSYVVAQIIMLVISILLIMFRRKYIRYIKPIIIFLMSIPLVYLVLPLFHNSMLWVNFVLSWLAAGLITVILFLSKIKSISKIMLLSILTTALLVIDQFFGGQLIKGSPLGYDVISGARFYGIGNEYMGVLIGASCIAVGSIMDIFSYKYKIGARVFGYGLLAIVLFTLAHPAMGVNVGGSASAAAAFLAFILIQRGTRLSYKHFIYISGFVILILACAFTFDSLSSVESQSHMGRTIRNINSNGIKELFNIIYRKISLNLKLFRYTIWTRVLLGSFVVIIILLYRPIGVLKEMIQKLPNTFSGLAAAVVGSIAAFLANDSGIVAAATMMIFVAPPMIMLVIDRLAEIMLHGQMSNRSTDQQTNKPTN